MSPEYDRDISFLMVCVAWSSVSPETMIWPIVGMKILPSLSTVKLLANLHLSPHGDAQEVARARRYTQGPPALRLSARMPAGTSPKMS